MQHSITILPESQGPALCLTLTGIITAADFIAFFEKPLNAILAEHGHYSLFIHYDSGFIRWQEDAADLSFKCIAKCSPKARRCAYINPPESRIMMMRFLDPLMTGEVRYYNQDQYDEALGWIKEEA